MALRMNNLDMPSGFPEEPFNSIHTTMDRYRQHANYLQFQGAWNAVSYRYKAMSEYDNVFTASIETVGPAPAEPARFEQDKALFGFASNAFSMFDAFHYGMYAIGSFLSDRFRLTSVDDERKVNFRSTRQAFEDAFAQDSVITYFAAFEADAARKDLDEMRNMLTHRASPPRAFRLTVSNSNPKPAAEITRLRIAIDKQTTQSRTANITRLLATSVDELQAFCDRRV